MNNLRLRILTIFALMFAVASYVVGGEEEHVYQRRMVYSFPTIGEYEVLVADFHMHTTYSDGSLSPTERVWEAYREGFDAIAITDHSNFRAYAEVKTLCEELGIVLIRGLETGGPGHILVLGVSDKYQPQDPHSWASSEEEAKDSGKTFYQERYRHVAACGGVALYAHPHVRLPPPLRWAIDQGTMIGVEVYNGLVGSGWGTVRSHGVSCYPFAFNWALEHNLGVFADSDVHDRNEGPSRPRNLLLTRARSADAVVEALRNRRNIAWFNNMLWASEGLLAEYVQAVVRIKRLSLDLDENVAYSRLENLGAVPLQARIIMPHQPVQELELKQGEIYLFRHLDNTQRLTVDWQNLWISPEETLTTRHPVSE